MVHELEETALMWVFVLMFNFTICVTGIALSIWYPSFCIKVPVPRFAVGIVIGRNGEMIKKIQNDTGVRIQFKPGK